MNNLITKINEWADKRGLKQADPNIQWMRITEEVGEIRDVLLYKQAGNSVTVNVIKEIARYL